VGGAGGVRHLVITSGVADGTSINLDDDLITIGRSSDSTLVIVDDYTSTYHARLSRSGEQWILTDLDSTNGTRVDGERISKPTPVPPFTPVTIGTTTFELRP
jgi:pSer/pThr/pTyr-binding forkhead associated (FHA) protein